MKNLGLWKTLCLWKTSLIKEKFWLLEKFFNRGKNNRSKSSENEIKKQNKY